METDFYLNERSLSAYLEKDWSDQFVKSPSLEFAAFDRALLYSDYHERSIDFLEAELRKSGSEPVRMLEVGSSLGRTFYEVCQKIKSIKHATLVEPSGRLVSQFDNIFNELSVADTNIAVGEIRAACRDVVVTSLNLPFQELPKDLGVFDLVICSNVIDQCKHPEKLVDLLKKSTLTGGTLLLSCTYQWQNKYIGNASPRIANINDLFSGSEWKHLGETNIPFQVRACERHWLGFLSHVSVFKKL